MHQRLGIFIENPQLVTPEGIAVNASAAAKTAAEIAADAKAAAKAAQAIAQGTTATIPTGNAGNLLKQDGQSVKGGGDTGKETVEWASNYSKHRPPKGMSWKEIMQTTKHDVAKYKPGIDIKKLELHAWKHGRKVTISGKNWKVMKCDRVIGANRGKKTCYIRVECSANTIHGHPILESDYLRYLKNAKE